MAVLITLGQGLSLIDARELTNDQKQRLGSTADTNSTLSTLRDAMGATKDGREIIPILPDIVGEAAVLAWLGDELPAMGVDSHSLVERMAALKSDHVVQFLVRTAQDFAMTRDDPVQWLRNLIQSNRDDLNVLRNVARALPTDTFTLLPFAVDLTRQLIERLKVEAPAISDSTGAKDQIAEIAEWQATLGNWLSDLGRPEEALEASYEANRMSRALASVKRDDNSLFRLARSTQNVGSRRGAGYPTTTRQYASRPFFGGLEQFAEYPCPRFEQS
jgi:hypothetical protein